MPNAAPLSIEDAARERGGAVEYTSFAGASRRPPPPPAFMFGPMPAYLAADLFSQFDLPEAGCYRLRGAQVSFDSIILLAGRPLWSFALNHPSRHVPVVLAHHVPDFDRLPVRRIAGQAAIVLGPGYNVFGHWLIDFLPRLYVLRRAGLDISKLKIILPREVEPFGVVFLRLAGIPAENIVWHDHRTELLQPDELIAPTILRLGDRFSPLFAVATDFWVQRVAEFAGPVSQPGQRRKIYISRGRHHGQRNVVNRAALEARAEEAGYDIVYPEALSLPEQIGLFRTAGRIIGEYGSGLHGAICAPAGTAICALRGTSHHPGFAQSGLAEVFGHHLGYVFGETPAEAEHQTIEIKMADFERGLEAMEIWGDP